MKPIVCSTAPSACGCEVANSMNSIPSMPSGLLGSGLGSRTGMTLLSALGDESRAQVVARGAQMRQEAVLHLPDRRVRGVHAHVDRRHDRARRAAHRNGDRAQTDLELLVDHSIAGLA